MWVPRARDEYWPLTFPIELSGGRAFPEEQIAKPTTSIGFAILIQIYSISLGLPGV
jgi:hypothetical protein